MAFDGITIANVVKELREKLTGGRLYKIAQPEADELLLTVKGVSGQYRLLLSASATLPLLYLTEENKPSPMTAPNFCMLLRKHLQNGRILDISQPGLERIVEFSIEHLDEMGDLCRKRLIIELMGKHSNIIFCDETGVILDSIKRVSGLVSSVREVLPGKPYFVAKTAEKAELLTEEREHFAETLQKAPMPLYKAIYTSYTGISPLFAQELCFRADLDGEKPAAAADEEDLNRLYGSWREIADAMREGDFSPGIVYEGKQPIEFAAFPLTMYNSPGMSSVSYSSMSELLEQYYAGRATITRIRQKSADLRKIVQTALERNVKKYDLQMRQMQDTEKRDTYRIYGELLNTYGYGVPQGASSMEAENYYTGEQVTVPLDPTLSPGENAKRYFDKYGKMKRTHEALLQLTKEVSEEIEQLKSISTALNIAVGEEDLSEIKEELIQSGYIRRKGNSKKEKSKSHPFHYISTDGYDIYVGKNNLQNDELTFKLAEGGDWWFHAKGCPGSHVILKARGEENLPDAAFEEAAKLAAYYSASRDQGKVEVDYIRKKHVKKPNGARPGFVVYYTNYSMTIEPDIAGIRQL